MSMLIRQATAQDLADVLQLYAQPAMDNGKVLSLPAAEQHARGAPQHDATHLLAVVVLCVHVALQAISRVARARPK